jgi:prephenate dehydrogenase
VGVGRDRRRLEEARERGAIDLGTTDLAEGVSEASVVVVCTPVDRLADMLIEAAKSAPEDVLLTDAGSTKLSLVKRMEAAPQTCSRFVGAHPVAGSERSGVSNARADLFEGQTCVLTPTSLTPADRLERARAFWSGVGARLVEMPPDRHDEALASTSHLPHVAASALASAIDPAVLEVAAGAYRDGTRVAGADPDLWTAIYLENRRPLIDALDLYLARLTEFRDALADADSDRLRRLSAQGREHRAAFDRPEDPCSSSSCS